MKFENLRSRRTLMTKPRGIVPFRDREYNHFNVGNIVMVLVSGYWVKGKAVKGYRHHDGMVTVKFPKRSMITVGIYSGTILLKKEYDWLTSPYASLQSKVTFVIAIGNYSNLSSVFLQLSLRGRPNDNNKRIS